LKAGLSPGAKQTLKRHSIVFFNAKSLRQLEIALHRRRVSSAAVELRVRLSIWLSRGGA
jgi:hypothetical protein